MEYSVPNTCTATAPEGFTGDADEWEGPNAEGRPMWALIVMAVAGQPERGLRRASAPADTARSVDGSASGLRGGRYLWSGADGG